MGRAPASLVSARKGLVLFYFRAYDGRWHSRPARNEEHLDHGFGNGRAQCGVGGVPDGGTQNVNVIRPAQLSVRNVEDGRNR